MKTLDMHRTEHIGYRVRLDPCMQCSCSQFVCIYLYGLPARSSKVDAREAKKRLCTEDVTERAPKVK